MIDGLVWVGAALDVVLLAILLVTPRVSSPQYRYGVHLPEVLRTNAVLGPADHAYLVGLMFAGAASVPFLAAGVVAPWVALLGPLVVLAVGFLGYLVARREVFRAKARADVPVAGHRISVAEVIPAREDHTWPAWALLPLLVWVAFLAWGIVLYPSLPASIPTHFNANGVADSYSVKSLDAAFFGTFVGFGVLLVFVALAAGITRARAPLDPARPRTDAARQFQFRYQGVRGLLALGACIEGTIGLSSAETWGAVSPTAAGGFLPLAPTLVGAAVLIVVVLRLGQLGSRIPMPAESEHPPVAAGELRGARDDDADWAGGVLYHNRADSALLVPKRFGVGWTLNWGNPWAWLIISALVAIPFLLLLAVPMH